MSFHNVFCRSSQPCIRSELQWCGFVFLPKGFDKACTAGITRSMGHLFNTEVGMDKQLRCLGHPTVFQIRTNGDSITKGEAKFEFLFVEEYFFAQGVNSDSGLCNHDGNFSGIQCRVRFLYGKV